MEAELEIWIIRGRGRRGRKIINKFCRFLYVRNYTDEQMNFSSTIVTNFLIKLTGSFFQAR